MNTSSRALPPHGDFVAYMKISSPPADAQKLFEQSLATDPNFDVIARLNLGISFWQSLEPAAPSSPPLKNSRQDPYAWYNLGLVYKDLGGKASPSLTSRKSPTKPTLGFVGYLNSQLQHYDRHRCVPKALSIFPFPCLRRIRLACAAHQRSGNADAEEHLAAEFQK